MNISVKAAIVAFGIAVAGCSRVDELLMSTADKVNAAYPVSPDVRIAQEKLLSLLAGAQPEVDALQAQVRSKMMLRALNCSQNVTVGRLDTVAAVKAMPIDRLCLQDADRKLVAFYAVRSIGTLLARPALRPLQPVGAIKVLPRGGLEHISYGTFARDAGVAVLRDVVGGGAVVEIPGGRRIASLPKAQGYEENSRLSHNGQVHTIGQNFQSTQFYEAESGHRLWEGGDVGKVLCWLPELRSFVYMQRDSTVMIADGVTGTISPHPLTLKADHCAHIGGGRNRLLLGGARDLQLVEHERTAEGIRAASTKDFRIADGAAMTSGDPVPMKGDQLVVFSFGTEIAWLRLDDGSSGKWKMSPMFAGSFAKIDDSHLMLIGRDVAKPMSQKAWSFDIVAGTVAPADEDAELGLLVRTGERVGFMRRGNTAAFGDAVVTGEAVALDKVVAEFDMTQQMARFQSQAATGPVGAAAPSLLPARATLPGLEHVPKNAQIHIIGIYEGQAPRSGPPPRIGQMPQRAKRDVSVVVRAASRPIVLVLASYEAVNWRILNAGGPIAAVLLSGYGESSVHGAGDATVLRIGSAYAYSAQGEGYPALRQAVARYAGPMEVGSFQGTYAGGSFTVIGR